MITEGLKSNVKRLSLEEMHERSLYMIKLQLESDEDYLKMIRDKTAANHPQ